MVDEGIRSEFIAIANYGIIGLVQLELGYAETDDMTEGVVWNCMTGMQTGFGTDVGQKS